jgi:hypothetical protein
MTILSTETKTTIEGILGISKTKLATFETDIQYNNVTVTVTAYDITNEAYPTTESTFLSKAFFTMDFLAGGTGIAIGSPSSSSGFIDGMDTGIFKDFVIYPKMYDETTIASGGRNLYYKGIENTNDFDNNTNYTVSDEKGIVTITKNDEEIKLQNVSRNSIDLKSLENNTNVKIEKGPSCSSWTPAPEDAALMYLSQDGNTLNFRNPVISGGTISIPKITLTNTPTNSDDAVTKKYVDDLCVAASTTSAGLMSSTDKSKLDGIAAKAEVNQNAFGKVVVDSTTVAADAKVDTLTLAGSNVTLTPDATNNKVTISIIKDNVTNALGYTPQTIGTILYDGS